MKESAYKPSQLNFSLSPYSGLTRNSWIDAGIFLLHGIFQNIAHFDDPVVVPRYETEITYPNATSPQHKIQAEYFEGLARSFFIAAPLIKNQPNLTICGYSMKDYYKSHILRSCTKGDSQWVYDLDYLQKIDKSNTNRVFQQTVEMAALVICLWVCRDVIWQSYTTEEKDTIATFLSNYAHGSTIPHNWRMFNMLGLAFLNNEGYPIDKDMMREHAQAVLSWYVGDGWYRDGHSFDYYSCWAFNLYAPLWNLWYGYENEPYLAQKFEENSNLLMKSYPHFFDKDGFTNMWGRSSIYRNASTSAFVGNLFLKNPTVDYGLARRISSGSLLQFLTRSDLWYKGIPVLGFYRPFAPMLQSYSCAESPFWLAKSFLALYFPENHPFWSTPESNGVWDKLATSENHTTTLSAPALSATNHADNGITELRTGKVLRAHDNIGALWNYAKLTYNSKFPWESSPAPHIESQQYVLIDEGDTFKKGNALFWVGEQQNVLYRRNYFDYSSSKEMLWTAFLDLADFPVSYGMIRCDKMHFYRKPLRLTFGSFGFPDNTTEIIHKAKDNAKAIILKGKNAIGQEIQLAMTIFAGWENLSYIRSEGTNPDSDKSIVLFATLSREKQYAYEPYLLISQTITKLSHVDFTEEEIFPIKEIRYSDTQNCGGYGPVTLLLHDGNSYTIDYSLIEGNLSL